MVDAILNRVRSQPGDLKRIRPRTATLFGTDQTELITETGFSVFHPESLEGIRGGQLATNRLATARPFEPLQITDRRSNLVSSQVVTSTNTTPFQVTQTDNVLDPSTLEEEPHSLEKEPTPVPEEGSHNREKDPLIRKTAPKKDSAQETAPPASSPATFSVPENLSFPQPEDTPAPTDQLVPTAHPAPLTTRLLGDLISPNNPLQPVPAKIEEIDQPPIDENDSLTNQTSLANDHSHVTEPQTRPEDSAKTTPLPIHPPPEPQPQASSESPLPPVAMLPIAAQPTAVAVTLDSPSVLAANQSLPTSETSSTAAENVAFEPQHLSQIDSVKPAISYEQPETLQPQPASTSLPILPTESTISLNPAAASTDEDNELAKPITAEPSLLLELLPQNPEESFVDASTTITKETNTSFERSPHVSLLWPDSDTQVITVPDNHPVAITRNSLAADPSQVTAAADHLSIASPETEIEITIGRIDIRAAPVPVPPSARSRQLPKHPPLSLNAYLNRRNRT